MNYITLVYPYYEAPRMLKLQLDSWGKIPEPYKSHIRLILVDDASPRFPAKLVILQHGVETLPQFKLYRVLQDIPWNQHGARNLGAMEAETDWLFMSDIDHTLPLASIQAMVEMDLDREKHYTFGRLTATDTGHSGVVFSPMLDNTGRAKPHPNTFLATKEAFWAAGGYDEDYCGTYGGDGPFHRWLQRVSIREHLPDVQVVRWPREVVPDASRPQEERDKYKPLYRPLFDSKGGGKAGKPRSWVRFPWRREL